MKKKLRKMPKAKTTERKIPRKKSVLHEGDVCYTSIAAENSNAVEDTETTWRHSRRITLNPGSKLALKFPHLVKSPSGAMHMGKSSFEKGPWFNEVAMVTKFDGDREASATGLALGAPSGCGQGSGATDPLCPPLLLGSANLGSPSPGHRQTQLPQNILENVSQN